jgi:hypothetical protein
MFGQQASRGWRMEMSYPNEGICLQISYRRECADGVLTRISMWDGKKVGRTVHEGSYEPVRSLFREMLRTARAVGPWV